jgi:adenylate cyclase
VTASPKQQKGRLSWLRKLRKGRYGIVLGVATVIFLCSGLRTFLNLNTVRRWEGIAHDLRFRLRGDLPSSPQIAIVGITTTSLDQAALAGLAAQSETVRRMHENVWPWPRGIHARVIEKLFSAGARVVAVDIGLPSERAGDDELVAVLEKYAGRVVLATVVQRDKGAEGRMSVSFFRPHPRFAEAAGLGSSGMVVYAPDVDDVIRRFDFRSSELRELGYDDDSRDIPHFAAQAAGLFSGKRMPDGYREILNFSGGPLSYPHLPVHEIFDDALFNGPDPRFERGQVFRDKLVFYGPIAEVLHDVHATPLGLMPGVEIHAQLAAAMLEGRYIRDASAGVFGVSGLLSFVCTFGCALLVLRLRNPVLQTLALGALLLLAFAGTQVAFSRSAILFPTVPWFIGGVAAGAFTIVFLFFLE